MKRAARFFVVFGCAAIGFCAAIGPAGCAGWSRYTRSGGAAGTLSLRPVEWNPLRAALPPLDALFDDGEQLLTLGGGRVTVLRGGQVTAVDQSHAWASAGVTIPAADGTGAWLVTLDQEGQLYRLRAGAGFERVSERYGLGGERVRAVCAVGGRVAAFLLERELAVADGQNVTRYPTGPLEGLACGGGRVAALAAGGVRRFDAATGKLDALPIAASAVAFDERGRLFALTASALYVEDPRGRLALRYLADERLHGLVVAGRRVWFADGAELGVVEGDLLAVTHGAAEDGAVRLFGSPSGDVWTLSGGRLRRFGRDDSEQTPADRWALLVSPVFARSCSACHLPGGRAGIDLSTSQAWLTEHDAVRERVVTKRDMPPADHPLADTDRAAIAAWLGP